MVGTIIVRFAKFAKYASYCGLIFVDRGIPRNPQKIIHLESFYAYGNTRIATTEYGFCRQSD